MDASSASAPVAVSNIRLNWRTSVQSNAPESGALISSSWMIWPSAAAALSALRAWTKRAWRSAAFSVRPFFSSFAMAPSMSWSAR